MICDEKIDFNVIYDELLPSLNNGFDVSDNLSIYLSEINNKPLLTFQEEKELAKRISNGDENAKKEFVERNLRLVVSMAKKYIYTGYPFLDLIQDGNLGLIEAVKNYDYNKEHKFSTYATYWIRNYMLRGIYNKNRNIRIPIYLCEKIELYNNVFNRLYDKLNITPTDEEIAIEMGLDISDVDNLKKLKNDTLSLNKLYDSEKFEDSSLFSRENAEEKAINNILINQIDEILEKCNLNKREIEIIKLRYGINEYGPITCTEIGKRFNISRERARQLVNKAEEKIDKYKENVNSDMYMFNPLGINENNTNTRIHTIYEILKDYDKKDIDEVIESLSTDEKNIIKLRYGENLDNPVYTEMTKEEKKIFYTKILKKIKRILSNNNKESNYTRLLKK